MKTLKYSIAAILICFSAVSCYDLDIMPKSIMTGDDLLTSDAGIKKFFAISYHDLPVEDFNFYGGGGNDSGYRVVGNSNNKWEAAKWSLSSASGEANGRFGKFDGFDYWTHREPNGPYNRIRELNTFMLDIEAYKDLYTPEQFEAYIAEARFLRAFYYFGLVKYHGGVVLMSVPLDPKADPLSLQLPRSTEYDTYKFIYEDLKYAMEKGTAEKEPGRMNRYAAAALMTRVMLYAGTIAKYSQYTGIDGPATTAGFMNMSPEYAAEFFQYVLDAKKVVDEGGYSLHTGTDKEAAFVEQFQTDTADEDIFIKQYDYLENGVTSDMYLFHHWDHMVLPKDADISPAGIGCALEPTWNLLKLYQIPAIVDTDGKPVRFDSPDDFWKSTEMEPRARATFFFSGMTEPASGQVLDFQGGYYKSFPGLAAEATGNTANRSESTYTTQYRVIGTSAQEIDKNTGIRVTGKHGSWNSDEGPSETGFVIRKYVSNSTDRGEAGRPRSIQSWKILRYGEVLLNCAEAAYELGLETNNAALRSEAFTYIAQIRDRAGAKPYTMTGDTDTNIAVAPIEEGGLGYVTTMKIDKDLQFIRDERARELAFENHHMFDMMRWRVAYLAWQSYPLQSFMPYYVDSDDAWIFLAENVPQNRSVNFDRHRYYRDIPGSAISRNKQLIQNDGY